MYVLCMSIIPRLYAIKLTQREEMTSKYEFAREITRAAFSSHPDFFRHIPTYQMVNRGWLVLNNCQVNPSSD